MNDQPSAPLRARVTGPVAAVLLVLAGVLIALAWTGVLQGGDTETAVGLAADRIPGVTVVALVVTELGNTVGSTAVALVGGAVLAVRGRVAEGLCLAAVPLVASVVFTMVKRILDRARPPADLQVMAVANESLPSGHATMVAAAWTTLVLVLWPVLRSRGRVLLTAFAVLWAGAVGFTRVYLGVHWLSDVLAGWASGAALAFTGVTVLSLVLDRRTRRRDTAPA
ncbi:phosphatase PAP2 family protein [Pseudonocardia alni]|uniref:Undecaprenyl-diphosphatase n=1 Tax=Pseudonocardia alni TaxID=33907 RepID=A0A852W772_PSEA5|nr:MULTISPECIES: phosphatase PAP2 family protein [Pseudonocardia]MCO7192783.1 phosphatase PAP2 family protein [Pseudonocardia sp. McavD-2-B]MYW74210.1 phosphatase PAP2 family protein [Pseudonocardia sp. SID8383]NYG04773.1 undecaprenyl-diphosphatase [Pseudonocardia antarctica]OJG07973.1 phosphatidylglycerophosphatase B [Pseudonocardia autotrophica]